MNTEPVLVDTELAATYIGRSVWTVYRWAKEGRLTRHGGSTRGTALWDLNEMTCWHPDDGLPKPPPPNVKKLPE